MPLLLSEEQKEKKKIRLKTWYQNNREKILARMRAHYLSHREEKLQKCREWDKRNPDKVAQRTKRYRLNHPERCRKNCRAWYHRNLEQERERSRKKTAKRWLENRDEMLQRNREWASKNREKIRDRQKQYHSKNKERRNLKSREWYKLHGREWRKKYFEKHPGLQVFTAQKRRALKRVASGNLALIRLWMDEVRSKKFAVCYYCQRRVPIKRIHFDHIIALSKGGAHSVENLCVSCVSCNLSKNSKPVNAWVKIGQQVLTL